MPSFDWPEAASRLLKAELVREKLTFAQLAHRLKALGLDETEASVKNKLFRGTFSTAFLMQCLVAIGRESLEISSVIPKGMPRGATLTASAGEPSGKTKR